MRAGKRAIGTPQLSADERRLSQTSESERWSVETVQLDAGRERLREGVRRVRRRAGQREGHGAGDGGRGAARRTGPAMRTAVAHGIAAGMGCVIMAFVVVAVVRIAGSTVMVLQRHAHSRRDGANSLDRDQQRQQRGKQETGNPVTHVKSLYDSGFEPNDRPRFLRTAHLIRVHGVRALQKVP